MSLLKDRIAFYDSLGTLQRAGVSLVAAFQRSLFPYSYRSTAAQLLAALQQGHRLSEAMAAMPRFSRLETTLIAAGEASGAIDRACYELRDWFTTALSLRRQIISSMVYPLLLYHVACPLLYIIHSATNGMNFRCGIPMLLASLAFPWLAWLLYRILSPMLHATSIFGHVIEALPVFGRLQFSLESARFFFPLHLCLDAGLSYKDSISLSAECCSTHFYRNRYLKMISLIEYQRLPFAEAFTATMTSQERNSNLPALLATGQETGTISDFTGRIATMQTESSQQQLKLIGNLLPKLFYFALVFFIAYKIIAAWMGYFNQINSLL